MHKFCGATAAVISFLLVSPAAAIAGDDGAGDRVRFQGGQVVYQYTGRVSLDFIKGTGVVYGYLTQFAGLPAASLFTGTPSEATARLTFRADITFRPLPGNGDLGPNSVSVLPILVEPGDFKLFLATGGTHAWADPATFSNGTQIANFARASEQFAIIGPVGVNTASAALKNSTTFTIDGDSFNFRRLAPKGVTNVTTGNNAPLPGSTPVTPTFAFAGYALAIGN